MSVSKNSEIDQSSAFGIAVNSVMQGAAVVNEAEKLYEQMTREEKLWVLSGDTPFWEGMRGWLSEGYNTKPYSMGKVERLGIPGLQFVDGPRGAVAGEATAFPVSMARGATWDAQLEERVGVAIGRELREQGGNFFGGVCINLPWHPGWGRSQETYSDQPLLLGMMGEALARGIQKNAMACVKHFALNNMENGRFSVNAVVDEKTLHEVYLPHFERVVRSGALAVMGAYNSVNGEWAGQNAELLKDILRDQWKFSGVTITDFIWGFRDPAKSLVAGMDVEAPFYQQRAHGLEAAIKEGRATWEDVKTAAIHTLSAQLSLYAIREPEHTGTVLSQEHTNLAREVATRAPVLLKNDKINGDFILPIKPQVSSIALIGKLADVANTGDYGSSHVRSPKVITIKEGMTERFGKDRILYSDGLNISEAKNVASSSDIAVVVVGFTAALEGEYLDASLVLAPEIQATHSPVLTDQDRADEAFVLERLSPGKSVLGFDEAGGDREDLHLTREDVALIQSVVEANPKTVVLIVHAGAVLMDPWHEKVPAISSVWYSGLEGGAAIASLLAGDRNFSGRMPYAVAENAGDVPEWDIHATEVELNRSFGHRLIEMNRSKALFPLGWGLSYTEYELELFESGVSLSDNFTGAVDVRVNNVGDMSGTHVVQIYASRKSFDNGIAELVGFLPVDVDAGGSSEVQVLFDLMPLRDFNLETKSFEPIDEEVKLFVSSYYGDWSHAVTIHP